MYHFILQGRALLNAIGNLELTGPYAEALSKLGYTLENVASQVRHFILYLFLHFNSKMWHALLVSALTSHCLSNQKPRSQHQKSTFDKQTDMVYWSEYFNFRRTY